MGTSDFVRVRRVSWTDSTATLNRRYLPWPVRTHHQLRCIFAHPWFQKYKMFTIKPPLSRTQSFLFQRSTCSTTPTFPPRAEMESWPNGSRKHRTDRAPNIPARSAERTSSSPSLAPGFVVKLEPPTVDSRTTDLLKMFTDFVCIKGSELRIECWTDEDARQVTSDGKLPVLDIESIKHPAQDEERGDFILLRHGDNMFRMKVAKS
ncbi:hypothetical protein GE09DRAFT_168688 [Coniochaeta sp. 2T2.1]|nr:hypothetical protein GE09DRAFT_168688 [Coniochaeta sp. 2T2.1]